MAKVTLGKRVPAFSGTATGGKTLKLSDFKDHMVVLYFYPRDSTPGCTTEGQEFRDAKAKFSRINTIILGISRDSLSSHEKFKAKQQFNFELISDEDESICNLFDVIKEKNLYGKKHMGIERSTFIIDSQGILRQEWRKVKVKGHVDEVLTACKSLAKDT